MVVAGKDYGQVFGKLSAVYVNLGSGQGVKVGDYFRIFRYQGSMAEDRAAKQRLSVLDVRLRERPRTVRME